MKYSGPEKRRHPRIPITVRVNLVDSRKINYLFTHDISMCGIGLISDDRFRQGELIDMEIAISGVEKFIKVRGKVVRIIQSDPKGIGVDFVRFAPHSKSRLSKALKK